MKKLASLLVLVSLCSIAMSQNLVPNPSFEKQGGRATASNHFPERVTLDRTTAVDGACLLYTSDAADE